MSCLDPDVELASMYNDFNGTALQFHIKRCKAEKLPQNQSCMNETELYNYYKNAMIYFRIPVTYVDYEDISKPVKSILRRINLVKLSSEQTVRKIFHLKSH